MARSRNHCCDGNATRTSLGTVDVHMSRSVYVTLNVLPWSHNMCSVCFCAACISANDTEQTWVCVISGFSREIDEIAIHWDITRPTDFSTFENGTDRLS